MSHGIIGEEEVVELEHMEIQYKCKVISLLFFIVYKYRRCNHNWWDNDVTYKNVKYYDNVVLMFAIRIKVYL